MQTIIAPRRTRTPLEYLHPKVFLAGSIEMGAAPEWQKDVIERLKDEDGFIFNPRREDWDSSWKQEITNDKFREQVEWELDHLKMSDTVFFYFDPESKAPVTLLELGLVAPGHQLEKQSVIVVCPDGYWRKGNVDIVCRRHGITPKKSLDDGIAALRKLLHHGR